MPMLHTAGATGATTQTFAWSLHVELVPTVWYHQLKKALASHGPPADHRLSTAQSTAKCRARAQRPN